MSNELISGFDGIAVYSNCTLMHWNNYLALILQDSIRSHIFFKYNIKMEDPTDRSPPFFSHQWQLFGCSSQYSWSVIGAPIDWPFVFTYYRFKATKWSPVNIQMHARQLARPSNWTSISNHATHSEVVVLENFHSAADFFYSKAWTVSIMGWIDWIFDSMQDQDDGPRGKRRVKNLKKE